MKPEELLAMIDDRMTTVQALKVVEPFVGAPITASGVVLDVAEKCLLFDGPNVVPTAIMRFDSNHAEPFHRLSKGDRVSVRGKIESFDRRTVRLTECEVV